MYEIIPVSQEDELLFFSVKSRIERDIPVSDAEKKVAFEVIEYWKKLDLDYILYKMGLDKYFDQEGFDYLYSEYYRPRAVSGISQSALFTVIGDILFNGTDEKVTKYVPAKEF